MFRLHSQVPGRLCLVTKRTEYLILLAHSREAGGSSYSSIMIRYRRLTHLLKQLHSTYEEMRVTKNIVFTKALSCAATRWQKALQMKEHLYICDSAIVEEQRRNWQDAGKYSRAMVVLMIADCARISSQL